MSWIPEKEYRYSWLESFLLRILRTGLLPKHVAFIMDGNRRYAKINQIEKIEGHAQGFEKLSQVLQWCKDFDIQEVTVYAFSIENFKRSKSEVDGLLNLAKDKFRRLIDEQDRLREHGVRVKVIGNIHLLPEDLQELIAEAEQCTKDNAKRTLNVAFSYTSREEMTKAIQLTSQAVSEGLLQPEDISEALLERCLYTQMSSKVDLLIRTSGEVRLSDFLLWQSSFSVIYFTDILWPDFSVRNLMAGIFYYQRHRRQIGILEEEPSWKSDLGAQADFLNKESAERISRFLHKLDHELWAGKKITISKKLPTAEDQTNTMQQKKS